MLKNLGEVKKTEWPPMTSVDFCIYFAYMLIVLRLKKQLYYCQFRYLLQNMVLGLAPKPMISPSMGDHRQFENWGKPSGGTDILVYGAGGKAPVFTYLPRPLLLPRPNCQLTDLPAWCLLFCVRVRLSLRR